MSTKHTPGPWNVRTIDGSLGTVDAFHVTVAQAQELSASDRNSGHAERKANARLIAAAPELLEVLRVLLVMLPSDAPERDGGERISPGFCYVRWKDLRNARAAIAKATGEAA